MSVDPLFQLTIALCFAALLGGAAVHQVMAWAEWPGVLRNYRLLPEFLVTPTAIAIVLGEALIAAGLSWLPARAPAAVAAALLLLVFAGAMAINIRRGRSHIDCGCFGTRGRGTRLRVGLSRAIVARNVLLAGLVLCVMLPTSSRSLSLAEVGAALANVAALAFLYPVLGVVLRRS
jgi:hypothetical protein